MRIAIIGAGGVGGYFGGRLAAAGEDVHFVARGDHLAALRRNGLRLVSPKGDAHVKLVNATPDPIKIGQVDIVLFTVKMYDVDEAASKLAPLLGPSTVVITLQNGVEAVEMVQRHVPRKQIAAGVAYVAAVISEPGVIKHTALETLIFGELDGSPSPRLDKLAAACQRAGFKARVTQTIEQDLWTKFTRLTVFSGMTAVTRSPIGVTREDPDLLEMFRAACQEGINVPVAWICLMSRWTRF
jgi:2-dehydropantoate 2-reductase